MISSKLFILWITQRMLNKHQIKLIKNTIPLLEKLGSQLTDHFYNRLFLHNPELHSLFNSSHQRLGDQQLALYKALSAYAHNIDNPGALKTVIEHIAHKHTSFNIQADQYPTLGKYLILSLQELGGSEFTEDARQAWISAYDFLANMLIARERDLYQQTVKKPGGWQGPRLFRLIDKHQESELVKSFTFKPVDEKEVAYHLPGQYIGLRIKIPFKNQPEIRQYSLSNRSNGENYRITVKRRLVGYPGLVSNYLHDGLKINQEIELYAPAGDFYFIDNQSPVVLISAGVGLTPIMAILEELATSQYPHRILYLHACENSGDHSFKKAYKSTLVFASNTIPYLVQKRVLRVIEYISRLHGRYANYRSNTNYQWAILPLW